MSEAHCSVKLGILRKANIFSSFYSLVLFFSLTSSSFSCFSWFHLISKINNYPILHFLQQIKKVEIERGQFISLILMLFTLTNGKFISFCLSQSVLNATMDWIRESKKVKFKVKCLLFNWFMYFLLPSLVIIQFKLLPVSLVYVLLYFIWSWIGI